MVIAIGTIADAVTGTSDLAHTLAREGMSFAQVIRALDLNAKVHGADAVVVDRKAGTMPREVAVAQSHTATDWKLAQGASQKRFKSCSTFASSLSGNIGAVADALLKLLGEFYVVLSTELRTGGRTGPTMSECRLEGIPMYVVTVTFEPHTGQMEAFLPPMLENARRSLEDEQGCHRFDVCLSEDRNSVFLYELYTDLAAFTAHVETPHFKSFAATVADLVQRKTVKIHELV